MRFRGGVVFLGMFSLGGLFGIPAQAFTFPSYVETRVTSKGAYIGFRWDVDPDFLDDVALEVEVHIRDRCFAMPAGGKDNVSSPSLRGVRTEAIPVDAGAYLDVWNYYWPPNTDAALAELWQGCPNVVLHVGTWATFDRLGNLKDSDGNFALGLRHPDRLKAGVLYKVFIPLVPANGAGSGCELTSRTSPFAVRFSTIPNTCTLLRMEFTCPFVLGATQCAEYAKSPSKGYSLWERICAPGDFSFDPRTAPNETGNSNAPMDSVGGTCVDADGDTWFRLNQIPRVPMFGDRVSDCDDENGQISPAAMELCTDSLDNNCDGKSDCEDAMCSSAGCNATCFDGIKNRDEVAADCGGVCRALVGYCPLGPGSDGDYCGESARSQDPTNVYHCAKGVWDPNPARICGVQGCQKKGDCVPDDCYPLGSGGTLGAGGVNSIGDTTGGSASQASGGTSGSGGRGSGAASGIGGGTTTNASSAGSGGLGGTSGAGGQIGSGGATVRRCGNGIVESGEQCDGLALNGKTCAGLLPGSDGQVNCKADCTIDTILCKATPDACDGIDAPANGVIDDNDLCWRPVYRFWDESRLLDARPRCYGNLPTPPVYCAGYTREYNATSGVIYGPVFYLYDTEIAGTVALIAFDNAQSHILTRSDQHDDLVILRDATFGYIERGTIGYIWNPAQSGPSGNFYAPKDAATRLVRDLRRYSLPSAGIQLYANNPEETAPAWQFDGLTGYVWGSRW